MHKKAALCVGACLTAFWLNATHVQAQTSEASINSGPDFCINTLADFQTEDPEARYQFYSLTQEIASDATPDFTQALSDYGTEIVPKGSNILDVIEDATNPVVRQVAPEIAVSNLAFVINFAEQCESVLTGQINSLKAYDSNLSDTEFNALIAEDALFLRQVLSDSLYRLEVDKDPRHSAAITQYADSLIRTRDAVEFSTFMSEIDDLEDLYMTDLDGRLKRSNDLINKEVDREVLGDAVSLSNSMSDAAAARAKQDRILSLIRIMGGRL